MQVCDVMVYVPVTIATRAWERRQEVDLRLIEVCPGDPATAQMMTASGVVAVKDIDNFREVDG